MKIRVLVAAAVLASPAAAAPGSSVTLSVERFYARGYGSLKFSGTISKPAANEYVSVLAQRCGANFSTAVAGALTRADGSWEVANSVEEISGTYRASWKGRFSDPVTIRPRLPLTLDKLPGRRYRVTVQLWSTFQDMRGRVVELQRFGRAGWTRVRRARLTLGDLDYGQSFSATFDIRKRGLTLRVFAPAKSAAPCFSANVTRTWVS